MPEQDESLVVSLVQRHLKYTGSAVARRVLADWPAAKASFVKVFPHEFRAALENDATAAVRRSLPLAFQLLLKLFCLHGWHAGVHVLWDGTLGIQ